ncbi:MAG TPA: NAD(+)--dinitrogen-reductase ADP-D-ribosyltransferase [Geobacteraceae bacterium]|nr:NAD(+)--dinitrogen-reductase ADP-D-ribosyltransferase [Geobacteraceae bacterium]
MHNGSYNHCNLPPWVISSRHFNDNPQPIELMGVREGNKFLFQRLREMDSAEERAVFFNDYMSVKFQLHQWGEQSTDKARKSIKNSYLRFLRGWGMDSNSVEGAVLKGWVESRIGLPPTFHKTRIKGIHSEEYYFFAIDRMKGSERTNAINSQLDLLYEYSQFELAKRFPGERYLTLYRGVFDEDEHELLEITGKRERIVRLNNLSSFTSDEERAWEFGYTVWEVKVPICKIFFFNELLPNSILKGEGEFIVFGGEYRVQIIPCTI